MSTSYNFGVACCISRSRSIPFLGNVSQFRRAYPLFHLLMTRVNSVINMLLRLCHPSDFKDFIVYKNEEREEMFTGTARKFVNEPLANIIQGLFYAGINVTLEMTANVGRGSLDPTAGKYDGCLGLIQANQSDLVLQLFEYPVGAENLTEGMIIYETLLVIGSIYSKTEATTNAQIMTSIYAFSLPLWLICLLFALSIITVLRLKRVIWRTRGREDYSIYYTITHLLRLDQMPDAGVTRKMLFLSASIFSLIVVHCFLTLIKTELVVAKDPLLYDTYRDIIDRKAIPIFVKGMGYDKFFMKSNALKVRRDLMDYADKSFTRDDMYFELDPIGFILYALAVLQQTAVVIVERAIMPLVPATGCSIASRSPAQLMDLVKILEDEEKFARYKETGSFNEQQQEAIVKFARKNKYPLTKLPDFLFYEAADPSERPYQQEVILNPHISGLFSRSLSSVIRRALETGLSAHTLLAAPGFNVLAGNQMLDTLVGPPLRSRRNQVADCMSKTVIKARVGFHALIISNYHSLLIIFAILQIFSFLVLILELSCKKGVNSKSNRPRGRK